MKPCTFLGAVGFSLNFHGADLRPSACNWMQEIMISTGKELKGCNAASLIDPKCNPESSDGPMQVDRGCSQRVAEGSPGAGPGLGLDEMPDPKSSLSMVQRAAPIYRSDFVIHRFWLQS